MGADEHSGAMRERASAIERAPLTAGSDGYFYAG